MSSNFLHKNHFTFFRDDLRPPLSFNLANAVFAGKMKQSRNNVGCWSLPYTVIFSSRLHCNRINCSFQLSFRREQVQGHQLGSMQHGNKNDAINKQPKQKFVYAMHIQVTFQSSCLFVNTRYPPWLHKTEEFLRLNLPKPVKNGL